MSNVHNKLACFNRKKLVVSVCVCVHEYEDTFRETRTWSALLIATAVEKKPRVSKTWGRLDRG